MFINIWQINVGIGWRVNRRVGVWWLVVTFIESPKTKYNFAGIYIPSPKSPSQLAHASKDSSWKIQKNCLHLSRKSLGSFKTLSPPKIHITPDSLASSINPIHRYLSYRIHDPGFLDLKEEDHIFFLERLIKPECVTKVLVLVKIIGKLHERGLLKKCP